MRIDAFLFENGYTESRNEAKNFVLSGAVTVNGKVVLKPSFSVTDEDDIQLDRATKKYVSRGGLKLEEALRTFKIDASSRLAIDIGASSGGFTDCLLQNGAQHVIAIDVGTAQLVSSLRSDNRVSVYENFNARYMKPEDLEYVPNLAVMDVSFISATYIIPSVYDVLSDRSDFVCLIKPQFEVGKQGISKGGIVRDGKTRKCAIDKVTDFASTVGFKLISVIKSPIEGGDGNIEFLAHFKKE